MGESEFIQISGAEPAGLTSTITFTRKWVAAPDMDAGQFRSGSGQCVDVEANQASGHSLSGETAAATVAAQVPR